MASQHKSPFADRLLSNSPDPMKSSILRESGLGWNSSSSTGSLSSTNSAGSITSPLRIAKRDRDSPVRPRGADVARRTSSSFRHVRNNNLVSKSPFKSQLPTPTTPTRVFPMPPTRRVSGEKRPRPSSLHEFSEAENERPFSAKRERKQSKTFQGLIEKEPVTKSPFKNMQAETISRQSHPLPPIPGVPVPSSNVSPLTQQFITEQVTSNGSSPVRSSLVSKRMHGPRLSGERRERRKTVTFDERCDVVEFDREDTDEEVFDSADEDDYGADPIPEPERHDNDSYEEIMMQFSEHDHAVHYTGPGPTVEQDDSYESIQLSDADNNNTTPSLLTLDPDTSITGIVDDMFFSAHAGRADNSVDSNHNIALRETETLADREIDDNHYPAEQVTPISFSPLQRQSPHQASPTAYPFNLNLPTYASPLGPPATPPRRSSVVIHSTPPLGRSTHIERNKKAREEEQDDLVNRNTPPLSPSPMKQKQPTGPMGSIEEEVPKLDLFKGTHKEGEDQSAIKDGPDTPVEQDEQPQQQKNESFCADKSEISLDPSELSIGQSEVSLNGLLGDMNNAENVGETPHKNERSPSPDNRRQSLLPYDQSLEDGEGQESRESLRLDLGSEFSQGDLDIDLSRATNSHHTPEPRNDTGTTGLNPVENSLNVKLGDVDVNMDMRSALDRLIHDVAGARADDSMMSDDCDNSFEQRQEQSYLPSSSRPILSHHTATDTAISHYNDRNGLSSRSASVAMTAGPPAVPPKDAIKDREKLILEKRREARRNEEAEEDGFYVPQRLGAARNAKPSQKELGLGRPSRRRSMSTGDAEELSGNAQKRGHALLDTVTVEAIDEENTFGDSIEKELNKLVEVTHKTSRYQIRERETIYASSSDDKVSHMAGPGDVDTGRAWKTVRRPSDMNEYAKQIKEYRAQERGKAYGKVFVKVLGVKGMHLPLPQEPTTMTCTLNNGIHYVTTPECKLGQDCCIDQEFELIEHSKLEFTLTLKVRKDPHIVAQYKSLSPPPPPAPAPPAPPVVQQTSSKGGMRGFFSSSPKKTSKEKIVVQPQPPPQPVVHRLPENLARYLKPDATLARAFISFKDIAPRCDVRLFETSFPLIGQRVEMGGKFSTLQVGELVLQLFRLPPLPGIPPDQLPQSLEDCHRGLRHINWHKVTYFQGVLTQNGGDCSTWRRRQLRVVGANLVAFNDVTKKATATINLKKAIAVEDDQEVRNSLLSPPSATRVRSSRYDEYDGLYGVERSFRLIFPQDQEILFFADSDEEKARWLEVLRALVGHIPPHPLWAELLWQRQEDIARALKVPPPSNLQGAPPQR